MLCGGFVELGVMGLEWFNLTQLLYQHPEDLNLMGWRFLLQLAFTIVGVCFSISPKYLRETVRTGPIGTLITVSFIGIIFSFHLQTLFGYPWFVGIALFGASVLTLTGSIIKYGEIKERLGKSKWTWE